MKKTRILCITLWVILTFLYIMEGSYAMGLLLAFYGLFCVINCFLCLLSGKRIQVEMHMPYGMEKNTAVEAAIKLRNASIFPVMKGEIAVAWENTLTGQKETILCPFGLMPKGATTANISVEAQYCGQLRGTAAALNVSDVFGVFVRKRRMEASGSILIFPQQKENKPEIPAKETYDMESFRYSQEHKGDDSSEIFDIREYVPGDSMRKIHWKLTGKLDNVMVKESSYPVFNSILMLLETGFEHEAYPPPERMDEAVELYCSIATSFAQQNIPFEMGIYDYEQECMCLQRIENIEEIWNMMPEVLSAGRQKAAHSVYYQYLASAGNRHFAHYIYVAADGSFGDVEAAAGTENITIIRCGDGSTSDEI